MEVRFDHGPDGGPVRFADPVRVIRADAPEEVPAALARMDEARAEGLWLAGLAGYELGYALLPRLGTLMPPERDTPLLAFGTFKAPIGAEPRGNDPATLSTPVPTWSAERYARAFDRVRDYIAAGDIYQANLTFPLHAEATGTPAALYDRLAERQPVGYGALVALEDLAVLSRSPELLVRIDRDGGILARPMKGTAPRGATPAEDRRAAQALAASEKDRAENLMIVDLLRNDVGRIAAIGSVRAPRLFHVETYRTVHQMVSDVTGSARPGLGLAEIFGALFPCGSVTGAPKIRAMEIIRDVEDGPRGAYCGATGWIAPDGSLSLSVAIRTLTMWPGGRVRLNVGGGVVHDSTAAGEYQEALWKARFATLD